MEINTMYALSRNSHGFLLLIAVIGLAASPEESQAQPVPTSRTTEIRQTAPSLTARVAIPLADHTILGNGIQDAFWSPDFNAIAVSGQNNSIHNLISGSTPVALPAPPVAWSTEGDRLLLRTNTDSMLIWKASTRSTILSLVKSGPFATWDTPDNKVAAGSTLGGINSGGITRVWSAITGQELFKLGSTNSQNFNDANQQVGVNMATNPEWNNTGTRLLLIRTSGTTGAVTSNTGSSAEIYDAKSWTRLVNLLLTNPDQVKIAHFSPDDSKVVLAGSNVEIRNAATGALIKKIDINNTINSAEWKPDGTQIVTATHDARYQVWNASTGSLVRTLEQASVSTSSNHKAEFSPNGQRILTVIGNKVKVWKASDGTLLQTFDHGSAVRLARWRPSNDGILTIESTGSRAHTWKVN
jgi:WD40 repeat protein